MSSTPASISRKAAAAGGAPTSNTRQGAFWNWTAEVDGIGLAEVSMNLDSTPRYRRNVAFWRRPLLAYNGIEGLRVIRYACANSQGETP
ncbi:hypothetical protein G4G28_08250 [Massilia sp. Dwa41.01b]|uniref:hypothetical protein n=1 Tax=Massilia sp. Dwa41.01b TaxID=2709302 RepID=UPI0015FF85BA|nr:hypothetical protein [Massilia sp. Dwa41.01b]QNA88489.1 hypothetical protein G4G28_08250 [Massilia sp. Dwa41.01b]